VVDCHPVKDIDTLQLDLRKGGPIRACLQLGEKKSYLQDLGSGSSDVYSLSIASWEKGSRLANN
jgi:hypothetical protein